MMERKSLEAIGEIETFCLSKSKLKIDCFPLLSKSKSKMD
jgi:hypothetical protein